MGGFPVVSTFTAQSSTGTLYYVTTGGGSVGVSDGLSLRDGAAPLFLTRVQDGFIGSDQNEGGRHTDAVQHDGVRLMDASGQAFIYFLTALEALSVSTTASGRYGMLLKEALSAFSQCGQLRHTSDRVFDALTAGAMLSGSYLEILKEACTVAPTLTLRLAIQIAGKILGRDTSENRAKLVGGKKERLAIVGALVLTFPLFVADSIRANSTVFEVALKLNAALDGLRLNENAGEKAKLLGALSHAIRVYSAATKGFGVKASDSTGVSGAASTLYKALPVVKALMRGGDTASHAVKLIFWVSEKSVFIDPPTGQTFNPQLLLQALIQNQVSFGVGYNASNGVWTGWTLNATTQAVSNYTGWDFNSFTKFGGQYLGASNTQGIASLGGAEDGTAAITATLQSAVTDFGNSFLKRVKVAYIGMNANGTATFSTTTDDNVERVYQLVPDAPGLHTERVQLARGVMSRYWTFTLQAVGADFRVDEISLLLVTLERRI